MDYLILLSIIQMLVVELSFSQQLPAPQTPMVYYYHPVKLIQGFELKPVTAYMPFTESEKKFPFKPYPIPSPINSRYIAHGPPPTMPGYPMKLSPLKSLQMDQQQRNYMQQLDFLNRFGGGSGVGPGYGTSQRKLTHFKPSPMDFGFRPLTKQNLKNPASLVSVNDYTGDINVSPHKYGYVRDYVDLLKKRQREHFATEDPALLSFSPSPAVYYQKGGTFTDDESSEPHYSKGAASSELHRDSSREHNLPKSPEIKYFKQRESEIGKQESYQPKQQQYKRPNIEDERVNNDLYKVHDDNVDDPPRKSRPVAVKEDDYNDARENDDVDDSETPTERYKDDYREVVGPNKAELDEDHENYSRERPITYDDYRSSEYDEVYRGGLDDTYHQHSIEDPYDDEESQAVETVAPPIRVYSQVRHSNRKHRLPKPDDDPRIREKVSTGKTHIVYKEEGYEDKTYDHGAEEKNSETTSESNLENQNLRRRRKKKIRQRRDVNQTVLQTLPRSKSHNITTTLNNIATSTNTTEHSQLESSEDSIPEEFLRLSRNLQTKGILPAKTQDEVRKVRKVIDLPKQSKIETETDIERVCSDGDTCRSKTKVLEEYVLEHEPIDPSFFSNKSEEIFTGDEYDSNENSKEVFDDYQESNEDSVKENVDSSENSTISHTDFDKTNETTHIMKIHTLAAPLPTAAQLVDNRPRGFEARKHDLTRKNLLKHLSEFIRNSSIQDKDVTDSEQSESRSKEFVSITLPNAGAEFEKYLKAPRQLQYKSLYRSKPIARCDAETIANLSDDSFNGTVKKRGGQLGDKLDCLKDAFFGKNPFSHPFFNEELEKTEVPKLRKKLNNDKKNASISKTVYDDIMNNINRAIRLEHEPSIETSIYQTPPSTGKSLDSIVAPSVASYEVTDPDSHSYSSPAYGDSNNRWKPVSKASLFPPIPSTLSSEHSDYSFNSFNNNSGTQSPSYNYNLKYQPPPPRPNPTPFSAVTHPTISQRLQNPSYQLKQYPNSQISNQHNNANVKFSPLAFPEGTTETTTSTAGYEIKSFQNLPLRETKSPTYPVFDINKFYPKKIQQVKDLTTQRPRPITQRLPSTHQHVVMSSTHRPYHGQISFTTMRPLSHHFEVRPQQTVIRSKLLTRPTFYRTMPPKKSKPFVRMPARSSKFMKN